MWLRQTNNLSELYNQQRTAESSFRPQPPSSRTREEETEQREQVIATLSASLPHDESLVGVAPTQGANIAEDARQAVIATEPQVDSTPTEGERVMPGLQADYSFSELGLSDSEDSIAASAGLPVSAEQRSFNEQSRYVTSEMRPRTDTINRLFGQAGISPSEGALVRITDTDGNDYGMRAIPFAGLPDDVRRVVDGSWITDAGLSQSGHVAIHTEPTIPMTSRHPWGIRHDDENLGGFRVRRNVRRGGDQEVPSDQEAFCQAIHERNQEVLRQLDEDLVVSVMGDIQTVASGTTQELRDESGRVQMIASSGNHATWLDYPGMCRAFSMQYLMWSTDSRMLIPESHRQMFQIRSRVWSTLARLLCPTRDESPQPVSLRTAPWKAAKANLESISYMIEGKSFTFDHAFARDLQEFSKIDLADDHQVIVATRWSELRPLTTAENDYGREALAKLDEDGVNRYNPGPYTGIEEVDPVPIREWQSLTTYFQNLLPGGGPRACDSTRKAMRLLLLGMAEDIPELATTLGEIHGKIAHVYRTAGALSHRRCMSHIASMSYLAFGVWPLGNDEQLLDPVQSRDYLVEALTSVNLLMSSLTPKREESIRLMRERFNVIEMPSVMIAHERVWFAYEDILNKLHNLLSLIRHHAGKLLPDNEKRTKRQSIRPAPYRYRGKPNRSA